MRQSLATDRLSWLLTYISFVIDHPWTFKSIIDIAIDSIHIGRRIFSVNHSGARCLQPRVHQDPHACATRYLMSWHWISKHQNTGEFRQNCRAEYGIVTWRMIYSNAKSRVYTKFCGRLSDEPFSWLIQKLLCILIFKTRQRGCQLNLSEGQIRLDLTSGRPLV